MKFILALLALLTLPIFVVGIIAYVVIGFPFLSGWEVGEQLVNRHSS